MNSALKLKLKTPVNRYASGGTPKKPKIPRYEEGGTTSTQYVSNIPEYAKESYADLVGRAEGLTGPGTEYQQYGGDREAEFTALQKQGAQGIGGLGVSGQTQDASGLASLAANRALDSSYGPSTFKTYGTGPQQVSASGSAPQMTSTQSFTQPGTAGQYMNPYMQSVVDVQKREATRADDIARTGRQAQAVGAGAYGGSRQAIMESEANRNLQQRLGDIQTTGSDAAFKQAQQQFNTEQGLGLQSQLGNQSAGLQYGNQALQAALGNQQAGLNYGNQFLEAQRLGEASRQFGANYGNQALQTGIQGATALGGLGNDVFKQGYTAATGQYDMGAQQQQQQQDILNRQYADYQQQMNYPYQQLGFMSDILRGTQGTTRSMYEQPAQPSNLQNLLGLGTALGGASKSGLFAEGGAIDGGLASIAPDSIGDFADGGIVGYADGGSMRSPYGEISDIPPEALARLQATKRAREEAEAAEQARRGVDDPGFGWNFGGDFSGLVAPYGPKAAAAAAPTPPTPPADGAIDLGTASPYALTASAASRSAPRVTAEGAPTMAELKAKRGEAGYDLEAYKKQGVESLEDIAASEQADAEASQRELDERIAKRGVAGVDREQRIKGQLGEMGARGERAKGDALMQMGLSILTADPRRGWAAAVGTGGLAGLSQFRGDEDKLRTEKAKLDDSMDALLEARRQEAAADEKDRGAASKEVRAAKTTAKRNMGSFLNATGIEGLKASDSLFNTYERLEEGAKTRRQAASAANAANDTRMNMGLGAIGTGGAGGLGMKPKDYEAAVSREAAALEKAGLVTDQSGKPVLDPAKRRIIARSLAEQRIQQTLHGGTPQESAGWGQMSMQPDR